MRTAVLRRRRAAAQRLHRPAGGPVEIVRDLLAVQAQDHRAARLALRARGTGFDAAGVDAALADGSLVIAWLLRGTLHLVAAEDHGWLLALTAPLGEATSRRRRAQLGVAAADAERAVGLIAGAVAAGPCTRAELGSLLGEAGIHTEGQALPHLLNLAARRGVCVLGPPRDGAPAFVPPPRGSGRPRAAALAELARRYLRGHGPATDADLAAWSGLPQRDARAGLEAIAAELEREGGLEDLAGRPAPPARLAPRLLGPFDPYLLGWADRSFVVAPEHARRVHPGGGIVRATAIVHGVAAGTWTRPGGKVALEPFAALPARVTAALERDAAAVEGFGG
jgi:hypothetical protein